MTSPASEVLSSLRNLSDALSKACIPPSARERHVFSEDAFDDHPLTRSVLRELNGMIDITDADVAWIVEATLFQLRRLVLQEPIVDLDYLGEIRRHIEIETDAAGSRTVQSGIWEGLAPEHIEIFDRELPHD